MLTISVQEANHFSSSIVAFCCHLAVTPSGMTHPDRNSSDICVLFQRSVIQVMSELSGNRVWGC